MRHTLIPLFQRKILQREYLIRALIVMLFMLCIAGLLGIASLFPSFLRASNEERTELKAVSLLKQNKNITGVTKIEQDLASHNILLTALETGSGKDRFSAIVAGIISAREILQLTSLALTRTSTTTITFVLQGIAPTRESLLSFKQRLESLAPGTKVDLPVSQLAKSSNIQFSLQVVQSQP